jgi:hypothetical protein
MTTVHEAGHMHVAHCGWRARINLYWISVLTVTPDLWTFRHHLRLPSDAAIHGYKWEVESLSLIISSGAVIKTGSPKLASLPYYFPIRLIKPAQTTEFRAGCLLRYPNCQ